MRFWESRLKFLLICLFIAFSPSLYARCGGGEFEQQKNHLNWKKIVTYDVTSVYAVVSGSLCVGLDGDLVQQVVYRDSAGVEVIASREELESRDVVFLRRANFASAAQVVARYTHPLTITILESKKSHYKIGIKFLRNVGRSIYADDIRLIPVDVRVKNGEVTLTHDKKNFDGIELRLSGSLKISLIEFTKNNYPVLSKGPFDFERSERKLE